MFELKSCPFCGGKVSLVLCDDEGNLHDEAYREHPYSGFGFMLHHAHKELVDNHDFECEECKRDHKELLAFLEELKQRRKKMGGGADHA
jgi:hypothetical protein|nr:MAG TPA: restriction alleviation protein [Caudoviricetes sp.]